MYRLRVRYQELKLYGNLLAEAAKINAKSIADDIIKEAGKYPPVPVTSHYKRTGDLFRGWKTGRPYQRWNVIGIQIDNKMWYADLVVGDEQWPLHASHGWRRLATYAGPYEQRYADRITKSIERIWRYS